jgi:DNA segregation ATPase FtsK/SpoIIIE, S-DNA-T family
VMRSDDIPDAPVIARLTDRVTLGELEQVQGQRPVFGLSGVTLAPVEFEPSGTFSIGGAPGSGRTTAVTTVIASIRRWRRDARLLYVGNRRSSVLTQFDWEAAAVTPEEVSGLAAKIPDALGEASPVVPPGVVLIEGIMDFLNSPADIPLQEMIKAVIAQGHLVVSDGEPLALSASFPLAVAARSGRCGIVLQPDQADGILFRAQFPPRMRRADFPQGRGLYVPRGGSPVVVQVALP